MDEMPINFFWIIVFFSLSILEFVFLDEGLINPYEVMVPLFWIDGVDDHEELKAELVM